MQVYLISSCSVYDETITNLLTMLESRLESILGLKIYLKVYHILVYTSQLSVFFTRSDF